MKPLFVELTRARQLAGGGFEDGGIVPVNAQAIAWIEERAGGSLVVTAGGNLLVRESPDEVRSLCGDQAATERVQARLAAKAAGHREE